MKGIEEKKYWIWLSLIKGLGAVRKRKLLEKYKTPEEIYKLKKEELQEIEGIGEKIAEKIIDKNTRNMVYKHIKCMIENNIDIINISDKIYPQKLKEIYDPPISLYIKGNKKILNKKSIAIIGSREASDYGKNVAKYLAYNLSKSNINIVSGMARGIDSYAHFGSIYVKEEKEIGNTIAVVANGLDTIYPLENKKLVEYIIESNGTIISEYPLGTKPDKMNFPARNRIISGISDGIIVVEAKEKSGTLITVDFALEQGRDVFAVPGNITSINSIGTNKLIKEGAKIITRVEDLINLKY